MDLSLANYGGKTTQKKLPNSICGHSICEMKGNFVEIFLEDPWHSVTKI